MLLAVKKRNASENLNEKTMMDIICVLKDFGASPKQQNRFHWSALDEAVTAQDEEFVKFYVNWVLDWRQANIGRTLDEVAIFVADYDLDFQVKLNWSVKFPLLTWLLPHDKVTLTKIGTSLKAAFTFADFDKLSIKRANLANVVHTKTRQVFRINSDKNFWSNPFEEVGDEEKKVIYEEFMAGRKLSLGSQLGQFSIKQAKTLFGYDVESVVDGWKTKVYDIGFSFTYAEYDKIRVMFEEGFEPETYHREAAGVFYKAKSAEQASSFVWNEEIDSKDKTIGYNLTGQVYITKDYPLKYEKLIALLDRLPDPNRLIEQFKLILQTPDVANLIKNNGFPVKVVINIFMGVSVEFSLEDLRFLVK